MKLLGAVFRAWPKRKDIDSSRIFSLQTNVRIFTNEMLTCGSEPKPTLSQKQVLKWQAKGNEMDANYCFM